MKYVFVMICLLFAPWAQAGKERYSEDRWLSFGNYAAIVLPTEDNQADSKFYGLVVECSPRKGLFRVSVKDIMASPGESIRWETNKKMGSFINKAALVIRTHEADLTTNQKLVLAMKEGAWIKFENTATGSTAKYTLSGSTKAINSISGCS